MFYMLPFAEREDLWKATYSLTDGNTCASGYRPWLVAGSQIKLYQCPSDPSMPADGTGDIDIGNPTASATPGEPYWHASVSLTSYVMNAQAFASTNVDFTILDPAFMATIPASFQDGTSNTILMAEKFARCGTDSSQGGAAIGQSWYWYDPDNSIPNFADSNYATQLTGPSSTPQIVPVPWYSDCDYRRPSTGHTGGINVLLADASVRNVGAISGTTWWAACTPRNNDMLGNDW